MGEYHHGLRRVSKLPKCLPGAWLWLGILICGGSVVAATASAQDDLNRGLRCLYVSSVALGSERGYEELKEIASEPASERGYSLTELRNVADRLGFATSLVQTSYDRLAARSERQPFLCIGWRNDEHF